MPRVLRLIVAGCILWMPPGLGVHAAGWQQGPGYRVTKATPAQPGRTGFRLMPETETGLRFTNVLDQARSLTNQIYLNGAGVALGDIDGDGRCDIYLCGLDNANVLYQNLGDWRFRDMTASAGVACADQASTGAAFADVEGDGDLDLLVNGIGRGVRLFLNGGKGHFREATQEWGLGGKTGSTSLALADIDGDGFLDLYVANYRTRTLRDEPDTRFKVSTQNGRFELLSVDGQPANAPEVKGRFTIDRSRGVLENGEPDVLYRNDGRGHFTPLNWTDGTFLETDGKPISPPYDWGLSVMFRDLNEDGAPDIYVCNDFHPEDRIWMNDGRGRFRAIAPLVLRHTSLFSMGVDFADVDRDGHDDIFVADMLSRDHTRRQVQVADRPMQPPPVGVINDRPQYSRNMLFWNRGDGSYAELAPFSGLEASDWTWCPVFLDVDLDGYEDLLLVNGHERDAQNIDLARQIENTIKQRPMSRVAQMQLRKVFPVYDTPNFAFRNRGDLTFEETGQLWGFASTRVSQGMALGDLDNDGDLDVVINCLNGPPLLYRNESAAPRVSVRLRGAAPNTEGIGAKVRVFGGAVPEQSQEIVCGGRYLSADDPVRSFAAGSLTNTLRIEVTWRSGRRSVVASALPNCRYEIDERGAESFKVSQPRALAPLFEDASGQTPFTHVETPYDDFQQQPLIPRRLSQGGPGVSWFDYDGDGWEDLIISSGRGGQMGVLRNDRRGGFVRVQEEIFSAPVTRDQTTVLGWLVQPEKRALLVGSANYEDGLTNGPSVRLLDLAAKSVDERFSGRGSSTGPLALADFDGDGNPDLFLGGQVTHGRYPEPASSLVFRGGTGGLQFDAVASEAFAKVGLVNGAVWSDLDGDGAPELLLACEWGPLRIFRYRGGRFPEITAELGLDRYLGWWQGVNVGDFDGDGRLDIIAGNWGRNSKYQAFLREPLRIYGGDLNGDGVVEVIEAYFDPDLKKVVPWRDWESLARLLPFLRESYHSFKEFSTAGVAEFLGARRSEMREWTANTLDSMVFLNRGSRFDARPLPREAQLAPVFGLAVADFDGDGNEDVYLSQNYFGVPADGSRYDAGRGLVLRGEGDGAFAPMTGLASGVQVYGEGRAAAVCDYDHDGRPDLAIGQNANATRLFHNLNGKPGLRVRLHGAPANADAIGAILRVEYADGRKGPAREIHAGSGYWSQDAAVQIISRAAEPRFLHVVWPGGKSVRVPIPNDATEFRFKLSAADAR